MIHTIIVPGVGGSEAQHWQSWLHNQLKSSSRVEQRDWYAPLLPEWVQQLVKTITSVEGPVQLVAHSFGCLVSIAALAQQPKLRHKIKHLTLVAPANPERFSAVGFAHPHLDSYATYFSHQQLQIPTQLIISENDPWFHFEDVMRYAKIWGVKPVNLGKVGHINVASGFGPFPEIFDYMLVERVLPRMVNRHPIALFA